MNLQFLQSKNFKVSLLVLFGVFVIAFGLYFFCDKFSCPFFEKGLVYSFENGKVKIFAEFPEGYALKVNNKNLLNYYLGLLETRVFFNLKSLDQPIKKIIFSYTDRIQPLFIAASEVGKADYSYSYSIENEKLILKIQIDKNVLLNPVQRNFAVNFYFLRFLFDQALKDSGLDSTSVVDFDEFIAKGKDIFILEQR